MSFRLPVRVYWEDTDAGGIVFYANYLKFMERARTEWLRSMGIEQQRLREETGGIFVVTDTTLKYHQSARLDDLLQVGAELQSLGSASLIIAQQVTVDATLPAADAKTGLPPTSRVLCEGTIRIGWVDARTMRPARLPLQIKGTLERFVGSMPQPRTP